MLRLILNLMPEITERKPENILAASTWTVAALIATSAVKASPRFSRGMMIRDSQSSIVSPKRLMTLHSRLRP